MERGIELEYLHVRTEAVTTSYSSELGVILVIKVPYLASQQSIEGQHETKCIPANCWCFFFITIYFSYTVSNLLSCAFLGPLPPHPYVIGILKTP